MKTEIKITKKLLTKIRNDLIRDHEFAFERVGFVLSKKASRNNESSDSVFLFDYLPVDDTNYIRDYSVGAKINGLAIRSVMQKLLDTSSGCFHVHCHPNYGRPMLSYTDRRSIPRVVKSFYNVMPSMPHGILLISLNKIECWLLLPKEKKYKRVNKISIIGYPAKIIECQKKDFQDNHF